MVDNELSDIKWKYDVMDEFFDLVYFIVMSGRFMGYSIRSCLNFFWFLYNRDSVVLLVVMFIFRRLWGEMFLLYLFWFLYFFGYDSVLEDLVEDDYVLVKKIIILCL